MEVDPSGLFVEVFDETEVECGRAGGELVDPQWAEVEITEAPLRTDQKSPNLNMRLVLQENSKQPKRSMFAPLYLTPKMMPQIDGWCVAAGLGKLGVTINPEEGGTRRVVSVEELGAALSSRFKGAKLIVAIDIEVDKEGVYPDKNRIAGMHRLRAESSQAIRDASYAYKGVQVKSVADASGTGKMRILTVKPSGGKGARTTGAPAVID